MKHLHFTLLLFFLLFCQKGSPQKNSGIDPYLTRIETFAHRYPQEKVYVHMDNTCYYLGDTIWFKAYLRETGSGLPSNRSGVLYAELLNHDGYLVERKMLKMVGGEGDGFFRLPADSTLYSGFYELRAYTRWQLNWGEYTHPHTLADRNWFFNRTMRYEFFRDYEKLYSRTFPVYDKPQSPGDRELYMSERPHLRYYSMDPSAPRPTLSLFPEGGTLVEGLQSRIAFEAAFTNGEYMDGVLQLGTDTFAVVNRGRGSFLYTPGQGMPEKVTFRTRDGHTISQSLPKAEDRGAVLSIGRRSDGWTVTCQVSEGLEADTLALTVMHEGRVEMSRILPSGFPRSPFTLFIPVDSLCAGVQQVTLFDAGGRVWADRLFFSKHGMSPAPSLRISHVQEKYQPYVPVHLDVDGGKGGERVSLSVRDAGGGARNDDTGTILTEMLLSSEIKGFVPRPEWYFAMDTPAREEALDLLMMTQGWRRFSWQEMASADHFNPVHPAEKRPLLAGAVHTYHATRKFDPIDSRVLRDHYRFMGISKDMTDESMGMMFGLNDKRGDRYYKGKDLTSMSRRDRKILGKELAGDAYRRVKGDGERLRHEAKVHCEIGAPGRRSSSMGGDVNTHNGQFLLSLPDVQGEYELAIWASDTTRWPKEERETPSLHQWISRSEDNYPEYYVRLSFPYPHFAKPYSFYQTTHRSVESGMLSENLLEGSLLQEVKVFASHGGRRRDSFMKPIARLEACDAFNKVVDAGLMDPYFTSTATFSRALARYHVAHMGMERRYNVLNRLGDIYGDETMMFRIGGMSPDMATRMFNHLYTIDSIYVYTDYAPRLEGDRRYYGSNQPSVNIIFKPGRSNSTSERRIRMKGFSYAADFYHPDYSTRRPSPEEADYRRTLYWNPNLKLDAEGRAQVQFYNNARITRLSIEAAGLSSDGTILWNKTE